MKLEAGFDAGGREFARRFKLLLEDVGYHEFVKEWQHRPPREEIRMFWDHFESVREHPARYLFVMFSN